MFAQMQPKRNFRKHMNEHMKHGTHNQHVVNLCASMRILCAYPHPRANTKCLTSLDSQTYKRFRISFATRFGHLPCNLATEFPRTQLSRKRRGEPTPGQYPVHLCAYMRTQCACPRTLMPIKFVKQPRMPPTVHQIEYVRTNATKNKTLENT